MTPGARNFSGARNEIASTIPEPGEGQEPRPPQMRRSHEAAVAAVDVGQRQIGPDESHRDRCTPSLQCPLHEPQVDRHTIGRAARLSSPNGQ